jgi:hypothetical protein
MYLVKKALDACGLNLKKPTANCLRNTTTQLLIDKNVEAVNV